MIVSRAVASALPDPEDRLRVWFELGVRGLGPRRSSGKRSELLLSLTNELRDLGVPQSVTGQRRWPGTLGGQGVCSLCGKTRHLTGRIEEALFCAGCWRTHPMVVSPCARCGVADYLSRAGLCPGCGSRDKITAVLNETQLETQPALRAVRDALLRADGRYLKHMVAKGGPWELLKSLINNQDAITHEALDTIGSPQATQALRSFLVAHSVLPERSDDLHSFEGWVRKRAEQIVRNDDQRAFVGYARWRHLRHARSRVLSPAQQAWRRRELTIISEFLDALNDVGLSLRTAKQADIDRWLTGGNSDRRKVRAFLKWGKSNALTHARVPPAPTGQKLAARVQWLEDKQIELLRRVFDRSENLDPGVRLAAGLVLLYGFRAHQIASLQLDRISAGNGSVSLRFGADPLCLPPELGEYAAQAALQRSITRFGGAEEEPEWLYPSPIHGRPVRPQTLSRRLATNGFPPELLRGTAIGQLAMHLPPAVLSRLTGLNRTTAARWSGAVSASSARNLPDIAPGKALAKGRLDEPTMDLPTSHGGAGPAPG